VGEDAAPEMRRYSSLIAGGIFLSRLSGLLRDAVLAFFLGANVGADAFRAALKIPNLLQNLLGEGVLSASFIPTYSRLLADDREEEAGRVAGAVLGLLLVLTGALVVLGAVFAHPLTRLLAPGFVGERLELTVTLVRIMFPGIGLLVVSAWCLGVLNSHRRFFLSYVAPVLWNAGILAVVVGLGGTAVLEPAVAAGWGVVLGGGLQVAIQVPTVRRVLQGTLRPSLSTRSHETQRVLGAFGTIVLGRGAVQLSALLELVVASLLAVGAVAVLGYAQTFFLLPIALFGMSVAAAELPSLSTLAPRDHDRLSARLDAGLARSAFFVTGTALAYLLVGADLVEVLFGRGEFDAATSFQVAAVLGVYSLGLLPATASRLLQSLLYSLDDARTPAWIAVVRVVAGLAVAVPAMLSLDQLVVDLAAPWSFRLAADGVVPTLSPVDAALRDGGGNQLRLGAVGLALGSTIGSFVEYALLRRAVSRRVVRPRLGGGTLAPLLGCAVAAAAAALAAATLVPTGGALSRLLIVGGVAGVVYLGTAWSLRVPEAASLLARIKLPPRRPRGSAER
jgi:putative peptidoglycan lipid II flippase